jgi:two-component system KDP operon response regulator KdpE
LVRDRPWCFAQPQQLRVLVGSLRKKIEPEPANPRYVVTEPGVGYRFAAPLDPD